MSLLGSGLIALGGVGAVTAVAQYRRMRRTVLIGLAGVVVYPFLRRPVGGSISTGDVLAVFVLLLVVAVVNRKKVVRTARSQTGRIGLATGLAHATPAITLQVDTRTLTGLLLPSRIAAVTFFVVLAIGVTAAATAVCLNGSLRSPAVTIVAWAGVGVYQTLTFGTRYGVFSGINWSDISPSLCSPFRFSSQVSSTRFAQ